MHGELIIAPSRERPMLVDAARRPRQRRLVPYHVVVQNGPDVPTPVTDGKYVYVINDRGIMWCLDAKTGKRCTARCACVPAPTADRSSWPTASSTSRMRTDSPASCATGPKFEILAENNFDDYTLSSPAVSEGQIFIRTTSGLWAIGKRAGKQ